MGICIERRESGKYLHSCLVAKKRASTLDTGLQFLEIAYSIPPKEKEKNLFSHDTKQCMEVSLTENTLDNLQQLVRC